MNKFRVAVSLFLAACATAAIASAQGAAQQNPGPQASSAPKPISSQRLTSKVYWSTINGFGAFIVGDKGVIVFDTGGSPDSGKRYLESIAKVTSKPVTAVILTHADGDHIEGMPAFPAGIKIIALEETKKAIAAANAAACAKKPQPDCALVPADRMPNHRVMNRESMTLEGVKMQFYHWAPAHTNNDLIIFLPEEKIVLAGDLVVMDQHNLPLIHQGKGGTSKGWVTSVQSMLDLDASLFVVGHRDAVIRDAIEKQLQAVLVERAKVKELYGKGMTLEQIQAEVGDPAPAAPNQVQHGPKFPPFSEVIYQEIKDGKF